MAHGVFFTLDWNRQAEGSQVLAPGLLGPSVPSDPSHPTMPPLASYWDHFDRDDAARKATCKLGGCPKPEVSYGKPGRQKGEAISLSRFPLAFQIILLIFAIVLPSGQIGKLCPCQERGLSPTT